MIERAKTGRGRVVGLDEVAVGWLRTWRSVRAGGEGGDTDLVFDVEKRTTQRDPMRLVGCRPHDVRRSFAITWLRASGSETSLRALCGLAVRWLLP